jgi:hypothetical protein
MEVHTQFRRVTSNPEYENHAPNFKIVPAGLQNKVLGFFAIYYGNGILIFFFFFRKRNGSRLSRVRAKLHFCRQKLAEHLNKISDEIFSNYSLNYVNTELGPKLAYMPISRK